MIRILFLALFIPISFCQSQNNKKTFKVKNYNSYSASVIPSEIEISTENIKYDSIFQEVYSLAAGNNNSDVFFWETWYEDVAFSVIDGSNRYIFYNREKFDSLIVKTGSVNGIRGIIAHELSHLLNNHPLRHTPSSQIFEREADYYSGKILREFHASIDESISAMLIYGNEFETYTHPSKSERIKEIKKGWIDESYISFRDYMNEFDSIVFTSARMTMQANFDKTGELEACFKDYISSRERFLQLVDSVGVNERTVKILAGVGDTLKLGVNFELMYLHKQHKDIFLENHENKSNETNIINVSLGTFYDIPVSFMEGVVYDSKMQEMGTIKKTSGIYKYKIILEGREYFVNSSNEIVAKFPDGSISKVGFKIN